MPIGLGQGWTYALSELPCQGCDADPLIWHSTKPTTPLFSLPHLHNGTNVAHASPKVPPNPMSCSGQGDTWAPFLCHCQTSVLAFPWLGAVPARMELIELITASPRQWPLVLLQLSSPKPLYQWLFWVGDGRRPRGFGGCCGAAESGTVSKEQRGEYRTKGTDLILIGFQIKGRRVVWTPGDLQ